MPNRRRRREPDLVVLDRVAIGVGLLAEHLEAERGGRVRARSSRRRWRAARRSCPATSAASLRGRRSAILLTWLITPPVEPRPKVSAAGPLSTSTRSMLKRSRLYSPMSRTLSRKRSPPAGKPRSQKICDADTPPSAAVNVTPGTLRSASWSEVIACCRMSGSGTVLMNCGMSRSGISVRLMLVVSVLNPCPSGGAVTFTSGRVCDCCASVGPVPDSIRMTAAAIGRFWKRDMELPLVVAFVCRRARLLGRTRGSPGWPSDAYLVCCHRNGKRSQLHL